MDVEMRLIWFVLAGFLLGFSVSTLWEWLYFRRRRAGLRQVSGAATREVRSERIERGEAVEETESAEAWQSAYRSPGVYLEFEEDTAETVEPARRPSVEFEDFDEDDGFTPDEENETELPPPLSSPTMADERTPAVFDASSSTLPQPPQQERVAPAPGRTAPSRPAVARTSRPAMPEIYRMAPPKPENKSADKPADKPERAGPQPAMKPAVKPAPTAPQKPAQQEEAPVATATAASPAEPRRAPRKPGDYPDDLAKIKGIGEVYKQRLYAAGIYTWHQIAQTDEETLRAATQAYPSSNADEWAEQAQKLAEKHGRVDAIYTGPRPQELTRIYGIGPVGAATLYRAGICTYAQLAAATPASLAPLFPIAVAGDEPDFAHWIAQARELSKDSA